MKFISTCLFLGAAVVGLHAAPVAETRSTLEEWVLTEKTISEEREAWLAEKATMVDLLRLLKDESELLRERQEEAESVTTQAEARRGELLEAKKSLREATVALEAELADYEADLLALAPQLPSPLLARVKPLLNRVPAAGKPTTMSAGQRAQNIIGVLGEVDKFNRTVTLDTQIQTLPDGRSVEVRVLWLGLGTAYYADVAGRNSGILKPGPEGWMPVSEPELAPAINEAIAQFERNSSAEFIRLPLSVQ